MMSKKMSISRIDLQTETQPTKKEYIHSILFVYRNHIGKGGSSVPINRNCKLLS